MLGVADTVVLCVGLDAMLLDCDELPAALVDCVGVSVVDTLSVCVVLIAAEADCVCVVDAVFVAE